MKNLLVKGVCGLGNRILALMAAWDLCIKYDARMKVCWRDKYYSKDGTNAFDRFFAIKDRYNTSELPGSIFPTSWNGNIDTPFDQLANFKGMSLVDPKKKMVGISNTHDTSVIAPRLDQLRGNFYESADTVHRCREKLRKFLVLKPEAMTLIGMFTSKNFTEAEHIIGVHVRWSATNKRKVNFDDLVDKINSKIERYPSSKVMLCSDSNEPMAILQHRYADRIILMPKWLPQGKLADGSDTNEQICLHRPDARDEKTCQSKVYEEAVTEMGCLSTCDTIIYQHNSSFGIAAAALSNTETQNIIPWGEETNNQGPRHKKK